MSSWHRNHFLYFEEDGNSLARTFITEQIFRNQLIDLFVKALVRAEIRFISRYVPQRSHEERLTGSLVSEIDSSLFLIKKQIKEKSLEMYDEPKTIDFFYKDLSRGGKIEKNTGADLEFILVLDLPDYPFTIRSIVLQAKKISSSAQLDMRQYETLLENNDDDCAYLFYDTNLKTLTSPIILGLEDYDLKKNYEKAKSKGSSSFSIKYKDILDGKPLSLFIYKSLFESFYGRTHHSFKNALEYFDNLMYRDKRMIHDEDSFNGRLGIISIGKSISYSIVNNEVLSLDI